jgi:hypothetical protein
MSPSKSQTTRLLCASVFLLGPKFSEQILSYLGSQSHGASLELGLDVEMLARVCEYARNRARRFEVFMTLCVLAALIVAYVTIEAAIGVLIVLSTVVYFRKRYEERTSLISGFRKEPFSRFESDKAFPVELPPTVISALPTDDQNLVVYKDFFPFLGAGVSLGGWSFIVDISKPSERPGFSGDPTKFQIKELYQVIDEDLLGLNLSGLVTKDFFFVNGREIRDDKEILPDIYGRPVKELPSNRAGKYMIESDSRIRHYRWIRVHDWDQELVMSYFLRCTIRGKNMFVEINRCLLTPIRDKYRGIDALPPPDGRRTLGLLLTSLVIGPILAVLSPLILFGRLNEALSETLGGKERYRRRAIREDILFDYGAGQGFRQAFSSGLFAHFFQKADGDFYVKVLEKVVLDSIIMFLDDRHVDTSDLRERQTLIMNSGIIVHGGDVTAESLAVGAGAQAVKTQSQTAKSRAKGVDQ